MASPCVPAAFAAALPRVHAAVLPRRHCLPPRRPLLLPLHPRPSRPRFCFRRFFHPDHPATCPTTTSFALSPFALAKLESLATRRRKVRHNTGRDHVLEAGGLGALARLSLLLATHYARRDAPSLLLLPQPETVLLLLLQSSSLSAASSFLPSSEFSNLSLFREKLTKTLWSRTMV